MSWKGEGHRHSLASRGIISNRPPKEFTFYPGYNNEYTGTVYEAYLDNYNMTIGKGRNMESHNAQDDDWWVFIWDANEEDDLISYNEFDSEDEAKEFAKNMINFYKEEGRLPTNDDLPEDTASLHAMRY